jgi:alanine racemase
MAMVKAFSYGSGGFEIAGMLQFANVDYLGVAYADEAIELRRAGITIPVMVLNTDEASFPALLEYNLQPVVYSMELLRQLQQYLEAQGLEQFPVHLEMETGMNRLGFGAAEVDSLAMLLEGSALVKVQSVFSHLAASDNPQFDPFTRSQAELFGNLVERIERVLPYPFLKHIANSAAILRHPALAMDMVRLGIGLYGIETVAGELRLQPVATLRSTIAQLKQIKWGESVSYNRSGKVGRDSLIATVRIGYADGYPRRLGNGAGKMWVRGQLVPVIGNVCMDMTMLDVTGVAGVAEGDDVVVFGPELPLQQVAQWADTIPYEIMTGVSARVKRVYFQE